MQINATRRATPRDNSHTNHVSAQMRRRRPTMNRPRSRDTRAAEAELVRDDIQTHLADRASQRLLGLEGDAT